VEPDRWVLNVRTKLDGGRWSWRKWRARSVGTSKPQGTRLGLAICGIIIERHDGQLCAVLDGKSGALFRIVRPIKSAHEAAARA
jgi:K+-sensing histidine kinase KdpD